MWSASPWWPYGRWRPRPAEGPRAGMYRAAAPRGQQGQVALPRHRPGVVVAQRIVQHPGRPQEIPGDPRQAGRAHRAHGSSRRGERPCGLRGVLAPRRTARATCGEGRGLLPGGGFGRAGSCLRGAAPHRRDAPRARAPFLDTDPGQREASPPWYGLAIQACNAPLQSRGVVAGVGHHDCSARPEGAPLGARPMVTTAHPLSRGPRNHRSATAWHGTITAPWAGPTGKASPREAPRQHQHGPRHPTAWAQGRGRHRRLEALEPCAKVHRGLLRRLRVAGVVDDHSLTALREKPFHRCTCWRRY
jgi:hypothetical protein